MNATNYILALLLVAAMTVGCAAAEVVAGEQSTDKPIWELIAPPGQELAFPAIPCMAVWRGYDTIGDGLADRVVGLIDAECMRQYFDMKEKTVPPNAVHFF